MNSMKLNPPLPIHKEFNDAMIAVLSKYKDRLSGVEMLAVASNFVGTLIAVQDQRKVTPAMAMEIVAKNIELGNAGAINSLMDTKGNA